MELQGIPIRVYKNETKIRSNIMHICGHTETRTMKYVDFNLETGETFLEVLVYPTSEPSTSELGALERQLELATAWWQIKICTNCYQYFDAMKKQKAQDDDYYEGE